MKSFLISDNKDTWVGMQLAGIDGVVVHTRDEVLRAIKEAVRHEDVGILILTEKVVDQAKEEVFAMKLKTKRPLIVEIPDRHGSSRSRDMITSYIREAAGISI